VGAVALAIALRFPSLISHPRMWAEEALVFFVGARTLPLWNALTLAHAGYLSLFTNVAGLLAAWAPLEQAPAVTTALAFAVQLLPFAVVLAGKSSLWRNPGRQLVSALVLLFVLPNRETWLTTTSSQFVLSLAVFLVALEDEEPSRAGLALRGGLVVLAGLTGPPSCLLVPVFAWRAFRVRTRSAGLLFALLAGCCLVQAGYLLHDVFANPQVFALRRLPITPVLLGEIILVKTLAVPLVGEHAASMIQQWVTQLQRGHVLLALGSVALWAGLLALAANAVPKTLRAPLLVGVISVTVASSALALGAKEPLLVPMSGERYYQAPNSALFVALAAGAGWPSWKSVLRGALVGLAIIIGFATYRQPFGWTEGPDWRAEIALWRADPGHMIRVWPDGWAMPLDPKVTR
jgi:hypothetical protein